MTKDCLDTQCKYYNKGFEFNCCHGVMQQSCYKQQFKNGSIVEKIKKVEQELIEEKENHQHFKTCWIESLVLREKEKKELVAIIEDKKVDIDLLTYDKALIIDFLKQLKDYISDFEYDVNRNSFINEKIDAFLIKL